MTEETEEATPIDTPAPGAAMPTPQRATHPPRRNAKPKPKHARPRFRNAGPPTPRPSVRKEPTKPEPTKKEKLIHLVETVVGAGLGSAVGAFAVKWGLSPELASAGLGIAGGVTAVQSSQRTSHVAAGAAGAAASQLLLMKINPPPAPPKPVVVANLPPAPQLAQRHKNAELGTLPPGMLDAAFERARAELAVAGDGYPPGYEHEHHHASLMR